MKLPIRIIKSNERGTYSLDWTDEERKELEEKILNLRDDQIAALATIVVGFKRKDIKNVVKDIQEHKPGSGHLCMVTDEASSKEELLWWVDYFTRVNKIN